MNGEALSTAYRSSAMAAAQSRPCAETLVAQATRAAFPVAHGQTLRSKPQG